MTTIDCRTCGARNRADTRRCRVCSGVINPAAPELERGLAALHPDVGFGTSFGSTSGRPGPARATAVTDPSTATAPDAGTANPEGVAGAAADGSRSPSRPEPRWSTVPLITIPPWEPGGELGDESVAVASTIAIDVAPRNGATPPPLEYESEHFDPDALEWEPPPT